MLAGRVPESEFERMRAPFMAGDFPFPGEIRLRHGRPDRGRPERICAGARSSRCIRTRTCSTSPASAAIVAAGSICRRNARCWPPIWRPRSTPSGMRRPDRPIASPSSAPAWSARWLRISAGRLPGARGHARRYQPGARGIGAERSGLALRSRKRRKATATSWFTPAASAAGLATRIALAGEEATVLEMSWYGDAPVAAPLGGAFHSRRLRLISSQVGQIAPSHRPRWTHAPAARRRARSADRCAARRLAGARRSRFEDLPTAACPTFLMPKSGILCQLIAYA